MCSTQPTQRFKIVTAFSDNYEVGRLCAGVNEVYARRGGYGWWQEVLEQGEMLERISPRTHCTWYKVHIFVDELRRALGKNPGEENHREIRTTSKKALPNLDGSSSGGEALSEGDYLVWMDADAVFVDHDQKLEDIARKGEQRDLIIGEDMHVGNLVNCGVIFIKMTEWSLNLWEQVFQCRKYDDVTYFEQSALHKVLKTKREFAPFFDNNQCHGGVGKKERDQDGNLVILEQKKAITPWHSFCITKANHMVNVDNENLHLTKETNAQDCVKVFEHSSIFPMHLINSNIADEDIDFEGESSSNIRQHKKCKHKNWTHQKTRFIFHAAGFTIKIPKISAMIKIRLPNLDFSELAA